MKFSETVLARLWDRFTLRVRLLSVMYGSSSVGSHSVCFKHDIYVPRSS